MGQYASYDVSTEATGPLAPTTKTESSSAGNVTETPTNNTENQAPVRPEYVPEKFWKDGKVDVEGLTKSYKELEKKIGAPKSTDTDPKKDESKDSKNDVEGTKKDGDSQTSDNPGEVYIPGVAKADGERFSKELIETGQLTEESYTTLEKAGYPKAVVDAYIKGIMADKSSQDSYVAEMKTLAGGDAAYSDVTNWAKTALSQQELADYNEAVSSGKKSVIALAVKDLVGRYKEATGGNEPKLINGKNGGQEIVTGFRSNAEVTAAMQDRRYETDPAYRQSVAEKLKHSNIL